jgi:hypothetical protein
VGPAEIPALGHCPCAAAVDALMVLPIRRTVDSAGISAGRGSSAPAGHASQSVRSVPTRQSIAAAVARICPATQPTAANVVVFADFQGFAAQGRVHRFRPTLSIADHVTSPVRQANGAAMVCAPSSSAMRATVALADSFVRRVRCAPRGFAPAHSVRLIAWAPHAVANPRPIPAAPTPASMCEPIRETVERAARPVRADGASTAPAVRVLVSRGGQGQQARQPPHRPRGPESYSCCIVSRVPA